MSKIKILSVRIERVPDTFPDLSYLGKYDNQPTVAWAIDRKERGDMRHGQYRYFNPAMSGKETGNDASPEQDYQRSEAYNRGDWWVVGIIAKAEVRLTEHGPTQTLRSGGLWGVESDGGEAYLSEIGREQLSQLCDELEAIGLSDRAITRAFQRVELVTR